MISPSLNNRVFTSSVSASSPDSQNAAAKTTNVDSSNARQATTQEFDRAANPYQSLFRGGQGNAGFANLLQQFETLLNQIVGTQGNDDLRGTSGGDRIDGLGGNDRIRAGGGNDEVQGGAGNDDIRGEDGHDMIDGGQGDDKLSGGSGNDIVWGGQGNDYLEGNSGDDELSGGSGNDVLKGNEGKDVLHAASQDDSDAPEWNSINGGDGREDTVMFENLRGLQAWKSGEYIVVKNQQGDIDVIKETERFTTPDMADSDNGPGFMTADQFLATCGSDFPMSDDVKRALDWAKRNG